MSKIAVFADCHIGSYGTKIDPITGLNSRLLDGLFALEQVLLDSQESGADAVLFAGDAFKTAKPSPTELTGFRNALRYCVDAPYAISGNHDLPRAANEAAALSPIALKDGRGDLHLLDTPFVHWIGSTGCQLAVLPYPNRARLASAIDGFAQMSPEDADAAVSAHLQTILAGLAAQIEPSKPSILMAHISVDVAEPGAERGIMAGRDITVPLSAIPEVFTFTALGHIHYAQDFSRYGRPNVFYCGSTSRIDFGEEGQEQSYVMMDTDTGVWGRIGIQCREFRTVVYDFSKATDESPYEVTFGEVQDAICRARIARPESVKPDYDAIRKSILDAGAHEFTGFVEDVTRVQQVRSEQIAQAVSLSDLLTAWSETSNCEIAIDELVVAAQGLEAGA